MCDTLNPADTQSPIVCNSEGMQRVLARVGQVASTGATVLLLGETGVGKELVAQAIHDGSPRRHRPMTRVNCAAIPATLIESELFGHERGAFTDAIARRIGRFEAAIGSTIFLDEIGEVTLDVQIKLLRVLEQRTIERLGSSRTIDVDVRIIAASNRNLEEAVRNRTFREDLFYRLNVYPISIPPLRERAPDIPALVWRFVDELASQFDSTVESICAESLRELENYSWPGNVRELRNVVERAMIEKQGPLLRPTVAGGMAPPAPASPPRPRGRGPKRNGSSPGPGFSM